MTFIGDCYEFFPSATCLVILEVYFPCIPRKTLWTFVNGSLKAHLIKNLKRWVQSIIVYQSVWRRYILLLLCAYILSPYGYEQAFSRKYNLLPHLDFKFIQNRVAGIPESLLLPKDSFPHLSPVTGTGERISIDSPLFPLWTAKVIHGHVVPELWNSLFQPKLPDFPHFPLYH